MISCQNKRIRFRSIKDAFLETKTFYLSPRSPKIALIVLMFLQWGLYFHLFLQFIQTIGAIAVFVFALVSHVCQQQTLMEQHGSGIEGNNRVNRCRQLSHRAAVTACDTWSSIIESQLDTCQSVTLSHWSQGNNLFKSATIGKLLCNSCTSNEDPKCTCLQSSKWNTLFDRKGWQRR